MVAKLGGLSLEEVRGMDPLERRALLFLYSEMEGNSVDWASGQIKPPRKSE